MYIGNLRIRSNLVLDDLPVVERGRDISILHSKVDFLLYITHIGILQDAVGASVNCEVTSKPEKQISSFIFVAPIPSYFAPRSLVLYSKLFQFPLLKDWNCGATLKK